MSNIVRLHNLHPDIVSDFLDTGQSMAIPVELQHYIKQIQWAVEIWEHNRNLTRGAKKLQQRILSIHHKRLSLITCKERFYDAMNYFNVDVNVPEKVWDLDCADKLEDLARMNIASDNLREARLCYLAANEKRRQASQAISAEDLQPPLFLISPNLSADELGYQDKNKKEIAKKANDGYYIKLISNLPIEKDQKKQLLTDADIQELEQNNDGVFE